MNRISHLSVLKRRIRHLFSPRSRYWHARLQANSLFKRQSEKLHYPLDLSPKASYPGPFDGHGIPLLTPVESDYPYLTVTVAQYALGLYEKYLTTSNQRYWKKFRSQAFWLLDVCREEKEVVFWDERLFIVDYDLCPPWVSGMAQGEALSVLCRLFQKEPNKKLEGLIIKIINGYSVPVSEGGFQRRLEKGIFFEEMPSRIPSLILNGFIFSLFGLYEAYVTTCNKTAHSFFIDGIQTLVKILPEYDFGFWSLYDQYVPHAALSSYYYHQLHIDLLRAIYQITDEPVFQMYGERWHRHYINPYFKIRAGLIKIKQRMMPK